MLWVWQPVDRSKGTVYYADNRGKFGSGQERNHIPRKARGEIIKLIPSDDPDKIRAVKLVFDLYVRVGLSRRKISAKLNEQGFLFNGGVFTHADVTNTLKNAAYCGDIYFGKRQSGEIHTFDANGRIVDAQNNLESKVRNPEECIIKRETHEPLIDRKTFELAQKKLAAERERTSYSPRNPAYYLKQIFVCGHCGKSMAARTERSPSNGKQTVVYYCSTYMLGRCNGHPVSCGYHRITHDDAEQLLLGKIRELNLEFDDAASQSARINLDERLSKFGHEEEKRAKQWEAWFHEGVDALAEYLGEGCAGYPELLKIRRKAAGFYLDFLGNGAGERVKAAIQKIERQEVEKARQKLTELQEEHAAYTRNWAKASDLQQEVLKREIVRLEGEINLWKPRTIPLSERFRALYEAEANLRAERQNLLDEYPALESREKGEAFRRLFKTVTLFWESKFHPPEANPSRPPKTERKGRHSFHVLRDRIQWQFTPSDLGTSW